MTEKEKDIYKSFLLNAKGESLTGTQRICIATKWEVLASQTTPESAFRSILDSYYNQDTDKVCAAVERQVHTVNLDAGLKAIKDKIDDGLTGFKMPYIEKNPFVRISESQKRTAFLISKCSATIGNVDVSNYCRKKALEGMNIQAIEKPEDKLKTQYPNNAEASFGRAISFQRKKMDLQLIVKK